MIDGSIYNTRIQFYSTIDISMYVEWFQLNTFLNDQTGWRRLQTPFIILNFSNNLIKTPGLLLVLSTKILSLVGSRNFQPLLTKN